jgi:Xaa-Pro aminopeptidase
MGADDPDLRRARRQALRALLAQADLAALLVTKPVNVRYLTGFAGSYGALLLLHDRTVFFTDRRYERHAAGHLAEAELVLAPGDLIGAVVAVLGPVDEGLGFEPGGLTWGDGQRLLLSLPGRPVVPAPPLVEELREVKDDTEVASIAEAARLGSETFEEVLGTLRPGVTEREVAIELELRLRRRGSEALAFDSIVAFGEQSAEPHHRPNHRPLEHGDLVKLDFGARRRLLLRHDPDGGLRAGLRAAARAVRAGPPGAGGRLGGAAPGDQRRGAGPRLPRGDRAGRTRRRLQPSHRPRHRPGGPRGPEGARWRQW